MIEPYRGPTREGVRPAVTYTPARRRCGSRRNACHGGTCDGRTRTPETRSCAGDEVPGDPVRPHGIDEGAPERTFSVRLGLRRPSGTCQILRMVAGANSNSCGVGDVRLARIRILVEPDGEDHDLLADGP